MADDLSIKILGRIDPNQTKQNIQKQLNTIANQLNIEIGVDANTIQKTSDQVEKLQKKIQQLQKQFQSQSKGFKLIDENEAIKSLNKINDQGVIKLFKTAEDAYKELSKIGEVKLDKNFNPLINDIDKFTITVKKANGEIEKLKYNMVGIDNGNNKNGFDTAYELTSINKVNDLQNLNEKILKQEQQIKDKIDKTNKSLAQQLELFKKQASINVQNLQSRYDDKAIDSNAVDNYLKKVNALNSTTPDVKQKMQSLSKEFYQISANARTASSHMDTFKNSLDHAVKGMLIWGTAGTLIYGTIRQIQSMYSELVKIDSKLTDIQKVSDGVNVNDVLTEATKSAYEFGRTLDGALDTYSQIFRLGYSQKDAKTLSNNAMLMATIGDGLTDQTSAQYLTSIMKQYGLTIDQTSDVIDKLNNLDNKTGASMLDIAQSLSKSGSAAKNAGIDFNTLSAMSASLSESLRISGSEAGNFLKTLSTRLIRKDTLDALEKYGVTVRKSNGELESGTKILSDLSSKWDTYNQTTKNTISQLLGGVYHINKVNVLMQNQSDILKYTEYAANSYGSATAELSTYQNSLEFKTNQLKASLQELSETFAQVGGKKGAGALLVGLTDTIQGFNLLTKSTDGWNIKLPLLAAGIYGAVKAIKALSVAIKGAELSMGWIGAGLLAVEGIGTIISTIVNQSKKAKQESDDYADGMIKNQSKINSLIDEAQKLQNKKNTVGLSTEETQKFYSITDELKSVMPSVISYIDSNGNAHLKSAQQIEKERKETEKLIDARKKELQQSASDRAKSVLDDLKKVKNQAKTTKKETDTGMEDPYESINTPTKFIMDTLGLNKSKWTGGILSDQEISTKKRQYIELQQKVGQTAQKVQQEIETTIGYFNNVKISSKLSDQIDNIVSKLDFSKSSPKQIADFEKQMAKIEDAMQNALKKGDKKAFANANDDLKDLVSNFTKGKSSADKFTISYDKVSSSGKKTSKTLKDATKVLGESTDSADDAVFAYDTLGKTLIYTGSSADDLDKALEQAQGNMQAYTAIVKGLIEQGDTNKALTVAETNAYSDLSEQIEPLNGLLENLGKGKQISASEAMDLINKEHDLAGAISVENGQVKINYDAVQKLRDQKIKSYQDMIKASEQQALNEINNTIKQINGYDLQLQSVSTLAEAKQQLAEIDAQVSEDANSPGSKIFSILSQYNKYKDQVNSVEKYSKQLKQLSDLASQGLNEVGTSADTTGQSVDDMSDSTDKSTTTIEKAKYVADKYKMALDQVEASYEKVNYQIKKYSPYSEQYQKELNKEISLLKQKKELLEAQAKSLEKQIKSGNITQYGVQTYDVTVGSTSSSSSSSSSNSSGSYSGVYASTINAAAKKYNVPPALIAAIIKQESGFNPSATSGAGAEGLMQLMPSTARSLGVSNPYNAEQNIMGGTKYIAQMLSMFGGNVSLALAAYNAGAGNVKKYGGIPPFAETQNYVKKVLANYSAYGGKGSASTSSSSGGTVEDPSVAKANKQASVYQAKSDLLDIQQQILDVTDQIQELYLDKVQAKLDAYDNQRNNLQDDYAKLDLAQEKVNENSKQWAQIQQQRIDLQNKEVGIQKESIKYLQGQIDKNKNLTAAQKATLESDLVQRNTDLYNLEKDIADAQLDMANKVIDTYKQVYQAQEQAATDAIDKMMDDIDKEEDKKQKQEDLKNKQKSVQDIQDQINNLALDNSDSAKKQLADLQQQLQQAQQDLDDTIDSNNVDARKQNLQDQQDEVQKYYDNLINDDTAFAKMQADILSGNTKDIAQTISNMYADIKSKTKDLGTAVSNNLLQLLEQAQQIVGKPSKSSKTDKPETTAKLALKKSTSSSSSTILTIPQGKEVEYLGTSSGYAKVKYDGKTGYVNKNLLRFNTGGYTGDSEGLAYLDKKEQVFNKDDTSNIFKVVNAVRDIMSKATLPAINNNIQLATPAPSSNDSYSMTVHINGFKGSDSDVKKFLDKVYSGFKGMGGGKFKN